MSTNNYTNMNVFKRMYNCHATHELLKDHKAFALLACIALRANIHPETNKEGLHQFEAYVSHKCVDLTEKEFRCAKKRLEKGGFVAWNRTRKGARIGSIATLINADVFGVSILNGASKRADNGADKGQQIKEYNNIKGIKDKEINLPLYFSDTDVIHALAIDLKRTDDSIKNLATAFVKHCGVLKTTYSNNAAFALQRDFKDFTTSHQQANNNPYKVPYGVPYNK
jgi:hypothetical protein